MHCMQRQINNFGHKLKRKLIVFVMAGLLVNFAAFGDGPIIRVNNSDSHQAHVIQGAEGQLQAARNPAVVILLSWIPGWTS